MTFLPHPRAHRFHDPDPIDLQRPDWYDQANCRTAPKTVFYPKGKSGPRKLSAQADHEQRHAIATYCNPCPVKAECLAYAMDRPEVFGVWGGTTPQERLQDRRDARYSRHLHHLQEPELPMR
jgi:WhiB family redox-sensing transcriptional regulator